MGPYDFRKIVRDGEVFPIRKIPAFIFAVTGASHASVDGAIGISCGSEALLHLTRSANSIELDVVVGATGVSIGAWFLAPGGWTLGPATAGHPNPATVPSSPGVQTIRFDFAGIQEIIFESRNFELWLQEIRGPF